MGGGAVESPLHTRFGPQLIPEGLALIETLLWDGRAYPRVVGHMARLARSAARLGWDLDQAEVREALAAAPDKAARVRLTVTAAGAVVVVFADLPPAAPLWRVALAGPRLQADDPWLGVKSTQRALYDQSRASLPEGLDELIFANTADEICEGTISNLFFDLGAGLCTPPLACGLLPGVLRAEMLAQGACTEAILPLTELPRAQLWLGNALRGMIPARLVSTH